MWRLLVYLSGLTIVLGQSESEECLQELPMSQLLRIKRSLQRLSCEVNTCESESSGNESVSFLSKNPHPMQEEVNIAGVHSALPLTGSNLRRSYDAPDEKPTKLQSAFQLSITALSFLAFGGYLLCMIVQAIKSKGTTYYHPTATNGNTNGNANIFRRIKVFRRARRSFDKPPVFDAKQAMPSPFELYNVMIQLAEGYVRISEGM